MNDPELGNYINTMGSMFKRRTFLSSLGHVGMVPSHAQPGDIICILFGVHVPFVLRPLDSEMFELVGESYVHGLMDGEGLNRGKPKALFKII